MAQSEFQITEIFCFHFVSTQWNGKPMLATCTPDFVTVLLREVFASTALLFCHHESVLMEIPLDTHLHIPTPDFGDFGIHTL